MRFSVLKNGSPFNLAEQRKCEYRQQESFSQAQTVWYDSCRWHSLNLQFFESPLIVFEMLTNFRCFLPDMFNILDYFFNTHTIFLDTTIQLLKLKLTKCLSIEDSNWRFKITPKTTTLKHFWREAWLLHTQHKEDIKLKILVNELILKIIASQHSLHTRFVSTLQHVVIMSPIKG